MPAMNMGGTVASNPSAGPAVLMSPFSGPKNSPFDAKKAAYYDNLPGADGVAWSAPVNDPNNLSTGALNTGIGFGPGAWVAPGQLDGVGVSGLNPPQRPNFSVDLLATYAPGITLPDETDASDARLIAIGGGGSEANGVAHAYNTLPLLAFGNGGSRDAGVGPAFTGFGIVISRSTGPIANGDSDPNAPTQINRSGATLISMDDEDAALQWSLTTASPAPALVS